MKLKIIKMLIVLSGDVGPRIVYILTPPNPSNLIIKTVRLRINDNAHSLLIKRS
jgi:hypothetical protein